MGTNHLFGTQGDLFDGPTVSVNGIDAFRFERHGSSQKPWLLKTWVIEGVDIEGFVFLTRYDLVQNQVAPNLDLDGLPLFYPGIDFIGYGRCEGLALVLAGQGTDQNPITWPAPRLCSPGSSTKLRRAVKLTAKRRT